MGLFAVLAFLLLLGATYLIVRPLIVPPAVAAEPEGSALLAEKERLLEAIRDLDMDFAAGKLSEDDHRDLRARYVAEAALTMQAIEELEAGGSEQGPPSIDEDVEREIAARKAALQARSCPSCGGIRGQDDRFCRSCGAALEDARRGEGR